MIIAINCKTDDPGIAIHSHIISHHSDTHLVRDLVPSRQQKPSNHSSASVLPPAGIVLFVVWGHIDIMLGTHFHCN